MSETGMALGAEVATAGMPIGVQHFIKAGVTSATRPSAGTRRCARSSTARATASTSSTSTRRRASSSARTTSSSRRSRRGGHVLFVGTKRQAQDIVQEEAARSGMYYVDQPLARRHAHELPHHQAGPRAPAHARAHEGRRHLRRSSRRRRSSRSRRSASASRSTSAASRTWARSRAAVFIIDPQQEHIAVSEARQARHPDRRHHRHELRSRRSTT